MSYLEGFRHAIASDADLVCQMDADLSHDPKYLPAMLEVALGGADLVIGSRYLNGISVVNWPLRRIILSSFANFYIRTVTGLGLNDITAGYRCWRRTSLAKLPLDKIVSEGYAFLLDVTFMAADAGLRIVAQKRLHLTQAQAEGFYAVHRERGFFGELVAFMISGPVVVQVLEGEDAVPAYRAIMGATNPANADAGTIRKELAESIEANTVHGSDSDENAAIEIAYFFAQTEIVG